MFKMSLGLRTIPHKKKVGKRGGKERERRGGKGRGREGREGNGRKESC